MFNWYREWLLIRREARICESCETLKHQLEISNFEKKQLLDRLLEKPEKEVTKEPMNWATVPTKNIPWNVRRQLLETEDRERAKLMREAPTQSNHPVSLEELEKDFGINKVDVTPEREAKIS